MYFHWVVVSPHQIGAPQNYSESDERWMTYVAIETNQLRRFVVQWGQQVADIIVNLLHPNQLGQVHDEAAAVNDSPCECMNGNECPPQYLAGLNVHIP